MTGARVSYLKTLSEEAKDEAALDAGFNRAKASKRIDALTSKLGR